LFTVISFKMADVSPKGSCCPW